MFIQRVELTNVKSYGADTQVINFGKGVNLIAGQNGAGKSTILEAIGFALFDALPYSQGDFGRRGGNGVSRVVVRMQSAADQRLYDIERTVDPSRYKVVDVEEKIDQGIESKTELVEWLRRNLKVNQTTDLSALFNNAVGMQQGTITAVFLDTPANRKSTFDALLRVQDYKDAWKNLLDTENYIKDLIAENNEAIAGKKATIDAHTDKPEKAETLQQEIKEAQSELENVKAEIDKAKAEVERLDALKEKVSRQEQLEDDLHEAKEALSTKTARIEEIKPEVAERAALDDEIKTLEDERNALDEEIQQLEAERDTLVTQKEEADKALEDATEQHDAYQQITREIERLTEKIATERERQSEIEEQLQRRNELDEQIQQAEDMIQEAQSQKTEAETTIQSVKQALNDLQDMRDLLGEEGAVCPVCRQEMGEQAHVKAIDYYDAEEAELTEKREQAETQLASAEETIKAQKNAKQEYEKEQKQLPNETALKDVKQRISELEDDLNTQQNERDTMPDVEAQLNDSDAQVKQAQDALAQHDKKITTKKEKRQEIGDTIGEKNSEKADLASQAELERAQNELDDLKSNIDEIQEKLDELAELPDYDAEEHKHAKDEYNRLNKRESELETAIKMNQDNLADIQEDIETLNEARAEIDRLEQKAKRLKEHHVTFQFVRSGIRDAGPRIRERQVKLVSALASRYFNEILNDYTMTLEWDTDDYGIRVEQKGEVRAFNVLSGGEQMIAALSVRLALLKKLTEIPLIFLDEPTINLDENRRVMLAEQLSKIDGLEQLFVISHDDTFIEESQHVIRVTKNNGVSEVAS